MGETLYACAPKNESILWSSTLNLRRASRTAEYAAGFRALESVSRPLGSRLFVDPRAIHFLRPRLQRLVRLAALPGIGRIVRWHVNRKSPGAMTSCIARTRLIDDLLLRAVRQGVTQIVLLGAGFDCGAYRLSELTRCRVVEIDYPSTQVVKKKRLQEILGALLYRVTGIPYTEAQALKSRGEDYRQYQKTVSAFFPWSPGEVPLVVLLADCIASGHVSVAGRQ